MNNIVTLTKEELRKIILSTYHRAYYRKNADYRTEVSINKKKYYCNVIRQRREKNSLLNLYKKTNFDREKTLNLFFKRKTKIPRILTREQCEELLEPSIVSIPVINIGDVVQIHNKDGYFINSKPNTYKQIIIDKITLNEHYRNIEISLSSKSYVRKYQSMITLTGLNINQKSDHSKIMDMLGSLATILN